MLRYFCRLLCAAALSLSGGIAETPAVIAIRNARIVTVSGPVIAKGTVVVRNGLIEAVGENAAPPADAWIIDGAGLTVYPGLIDAMNTLGLSDSGPMTAATGGGRRGGGPPPTTSSGPPAPPARGPEDRPLNTSYLLAADQISPSDRRIEAARNAGFTSAVTFPNRNIFSGQGAVINLAGERAGNMVVHSPTGMLLTMRSAGFSGGFPASLMGVIAYIRQIYLDAAQYKTAKEIYAAHPVGNRRPDYDKHLEGVLAAPRILLPAGNPKEIERMLRFGQELQQDTILYGLAEGYRAAGTLKRHNAKALIDLRWPEKSRDTDPEQIDSLRSLEMRDKAPSTAAELKKAGVPFAFYAGALTQPSDTSKAVKKAIDAGLPAADALRALTLSPAEIFGVADRLGSIDKGKIANLIVTDGELFQDRTKIRYVLVDGVKYEPAPEPSASPSESTR
ncbi:MAG: amidohydrolase family protein [Bryobacterales bacterium]|nr:amidohydrolase family protein [Bryobacterales bacterium]